MLLLLSFLGALCAASKNSSCAHTDTEFHCVHYIKNYDADTITVDIPGLHPLLGKKINIRLRGIDTPEIKTKNTCEKQKAWLAKSLVGQIMVQAKRVDLTNLSRGKYFRVVADVMVDGESLGAKLLKQGLAYKYDGKTKPKMNWCQSTRQIASDNQKL